MPFLPLRSVILYAISHSVLIQVSPPPLTNAYIFSVRHLFSQLQDLFFFLPSLLQAGNLCHDFATQWHAKASLNVLKLQPWLAYSRMTEPVKTLMVLFTSQWRSIEPWHLDCREENKQSYVNAWNTNLQRETILGLTGAGVQHYSDAGSKCLWWNVGSELWSNNTRITMRSGHLSPNDSNLATSLFCGCLVNVCNSLLLKKEALKCISTGAKKGD